jgi:hypothetical protein
MNIDNRPDLFSTTKAVSYLRRCERGGRDRRRLRVGFLSLPRRPLQHHRPRTHLQAAETSSTSWLAVVVLRSPVQRLIILLPIQQRSEEGTLDNAGRQVEGATSDVPGGPREIQGGGIMFRAFGKVLRLVDRSWKVSQRPPLLSRAAFLPSQLMPRSCLFPRCTLSASSSASGSTQRRVSHCSRSLRLLPRGLAARLSSYRSSSPPV